MRSMFNWRPYVLRAYFDTQMLLEMWREQAKLYGIDPMKIRIEKEKELRKKLDPDEEKEAILSEIAKLKIFSIKSRNGRTETNGNGPNERYETKLITEKQLVSHLQEGWEIVRELRSGKIVVERNT